MSTQHHVVNVGEHVIASLKEAYRLPPGQDAVVTGEVEAAGVRGFRLRTDGRAVFIPWEALQYLLVDETEAEASR